MYKLNYGKICSAIIVTILLVASALVPVAAGAEEPSGAEIVTAPVKTASRPARQPQISLVEAVATAEKMYYCGELYLFADSMIKTNYEAAAMASDIAEHMENDALIKNRAVVNALNKSYNALSKKYNTWVDVKGDLEYFIEEIGSRNTMTKSELATVFSRTLRTLNETKKALELAQQYNTEQSEALKRSLSNEAESLAAAAAGAVNTIKPAAQKAFDGYRTLFELFSQQAGLKHEYKTWENPGD